LNFWLDVTEKYLGLQKTKESPKFPDTGITAAMFKSASERFEERRIMKAIFADGTQASHNEFGEIYKNETKEKKKKSEEEHASHPKVNLDDGEWGEFDLNDDEMDIDHASEHGASKSDSDLGIRMDFINLRARFVSLILVVAVLPGGPFKSALGLLDLLTEFIKTANVNDFMDLLTAIKAPPHVYIALLLSMIEVYLPRGLPKTNLLHVDDDYIFSNFLHEEARTATAVDNAKLSLLVEYLIGALIDQDRLPFSERLYRTVRKGVDARLKKVDQNRRGKNRSQQEKHAANQLKFSGDRIVAYMNLIKGKPAVIHFNENS